MPVLKGGASGGIKDCIDGRGRELFRDGNDVGGRCISGRSGVLSSRWCREEISDELACP